MDGDALLQEQMNSWLLLHLNIDFDCFCNNNNNNNNNTSILRFEVNPM
jgi:hypothetical protein